MKRKALKAAFSFVYPMFEPASLRDGRPAGSFLILFQFFFGSDLSSVSQLN